jgi:hypothetical protein
VWLLSGSHTGGSRRRGRRRQADSSKQQGAPVGHPIRRNVNAQSTVVPQPADHPDQLERYAAPCAVLGAFLDEHGEPAAEQARERADTAAQLVRNGWARDDLRPLGRLLPAPWPTGRARDAGAPVPAHADDGDRLLAVVDEVALELRAFGG